ncbi:MAG: hypothetical protein AABZ55_02915 [Bdellovibrionota bacterium]
MKTITEFAAITLKAADKTRQELVTAGKTPEELPVAMGEALKLEGDKLKNLMSALDFVGKKIQDLKRVLVFSINEGEKVPPQSEQKDGVYFSAEYYPPLNPPREKGKRFGKPGEDRGRGKGGRNDKKRGRGPRRDDGPRSDQPRGPRPTRPQIQAAPIDPSRKGKIIPRSEMPPKTEEAKPTEQTEQKS